MLPKWKEGWSEGAWAVGLEGREGDVSLTRPVCGGPGSAGQGRGLAPSRQEPLGAWWAGR